MDCGGSYAGPISKLNFSAIALYGNGDYCSTSYTFTGTNKKYRMVVKGASDNSSTAGVSVYIGGKKVGAVSFTGTSLSEQSFDFKMTDVTVPLALLLVLPVALLLGVPGWLRYNKTRNQ